MSDRRPQGSYSVAVDIGGLKSYRHAGIRHAGWRGRTPRKDCNSHSVLCPVCHAANMRDPSKSECYLNVVRVLLVLDRLNKRPLSYAVGYYCPVCHTLFDGVVGTGFNGRSLPSQLWAGPKA